MGSPYFAICKAIPVVFFVFLFSILCGYVVYHLHQFIPIPPKIEMNCSDFVGESELAKKVLAEYLQNRSVLIPQKVFMTGKCWFIRKRSYLPIALPSSLEFHHFIYFVKMVSKDYDFVEETVTMMFSPQHFYCLPIDANSTPEFQAKIRNLGACILNIIVPFEMFNGSNPVEVFRAHNICFKSMPKYKWKHSIILQENEVPIQSIQKMGAYLYRLGDSSRIGAQTISEDTVHLMDKRDHALNGTDDAKAIVKHALAVWWSGSRDPIMICRTFQKPLYRFIDEEMREEDFVVPEENPMNGTCQTGQFDFLGNCILGMENYNYALKSKKLFLRADPDFDHGFVECLQETVFRRTFKDVL